MRRFVANPHRLLLLLLFVLVPVEAHSVPIQIPYSGQLSDGGQLVDGMRYFSISVYDAASGGSVVYTQSESLAVVGGIYHTTLNAPVTAWNGTDRWIGVSVNGGAELQPRMKLGSVPYAVRASSVETTTKIYHATIHPSAFQPFSSSSAHAVDDQSLRSQGTEHYIASVSLPDGAVLVSWRVCGYFPNGDGEISGVFMRRDATLWTPALDLLDTYIKGVDGANNCMVGLPYRDLPSETVDNVNYVYFVRLNIANGATAYTAGLLSVRVDYTLPTPSTQP